MRIGIVGFGYVGSPLAVAFAEFRSYDHPLCPRPDVRLTLVAASR